MPYLYSRSISINHTLCGNSNSSNFPVLISGTYPWLATTANGGNVTNANGYDIVFSSDAAGQNLLNYERELYTASSGQVIFWVQIPTLSHTADTVIYIWYGNSSITTDQSNPSGTWDSNFQGVYHFGNGSTLSANDSTSNARNGTISGATAGSGQIDGAAGFNLTTDYSNYVEITGHFGNPTSGTLSGWANLTVDYTGGNGAEIISLGDNFAMRLDNSDGHNVFLCFYYAEGTWINVAATTESYVGAGWHYFCFTVTAGTQLVYVDGVQVASGSNSPGIEYANGANTFIAHHGNGQTSFDFGGYIDEVRVSSSIRSADWITAEYNNQSSPSTLYSVSGSTTHNAVLSDSFSVTDVLKRKPTKALSETFTLAENLTRTPKKSLSETISPTDRLTRTPGKKLADTLSPSDHLTRTPKKSLVETISPSDHLTRKPGKSLKEAITPADVLVKATHRSLTDTVSPTDHLSRKPTKKLSETISPTDALKRRTTKALSDSVSLLDAVVSHIVKLLSLHDSITPTEALTRRTTKQLAETVSPQDAITRRTTRKLHDSISPLDALTRKVTKALHETFSPSDALTRHTTRRFQDTVSPTDALTRHTLRILRDAVSPTDLLRRTTRKRLADATSVSDRLTRTTTKRFVDSFSISDALNTVLRLPGAIRRFVAQWLCRFFRASEEDLMISDVKKPAGSSEKFEVDWTDVLTDSSGNLDPIETSTWTANPTDMTVASSANTTTTATGQLAAGTVGTYYVVENTITTASGQTKVQPLLILVTE